MFKNQDIHLLRAIGSISNTGGRFTADGIVEDLTTGVTAKDFIAGETKHKRCLSYCIIIIF